MTWAICCVPGWSPMAVVDGTVQATALDERAGFPVQKLVAGRKATIG